MFVKRPHSALSVVALFLGLMSCLPSGASILCIGADGHIAVESSWAPCSPGVDSHERLEDACNSENCSSCLDIPIQGGNPSVLSRAQMSQSQAHAVLDGHPVHLTPPSPMKLVGSSFGFEFLPRQVQISPLRC